MPENTVMISIRDHDNVIREWLPIESAERAFDGALSAANTFGVVYHQEPAYFLAHCNEHLEYPESVACFIGIIS